MIVVLIVYLKLIIQMVKSINGNVMLFLINLVDYPETLINTTFSPFFSARLMEIL